MSHFPSQESEDGLPETGTEIVASDSQKGLSAQQEAFVAARLAGVSTVEAATRAGYGPDEWLRVISDPAVAAALEAGVKAMLVDQAVDASLTVKSVSAKGTAADRVKLDAARFTLMVAGFVPPMRERAKQRQASLADMQSEDLRALVDQLSGELAARAKPIDAPKRAPLSTKAADFLE